MELSLESSRDMKDLQNQLSKDDHIKKHAKSSID